MAGVNEGRLVAVEPPNLESSRSGVSWGAAFAGGVTAVGLTAILLLLGAGLGLTSVSPFAGASVTATGLAVGAAIWLVVTQWLSSAVGGYMAGRLRTKWADHYTDEVFFRDTAHGLLAWCIGTIFMIALLASGGGAAFTGAVQGTGLAAGAVSAESTDSYFVDQLFRGTTASAAAGSEPAAATMQQPTTAVGTSDTAASQSDDARSEATPIFERSVSGTAADADRTYLVELVSARTGLAPAEAEQRVDQVVAAAKQAADEARKTAALAAIMTALSLLVGAFIAAVAGGLGGSYRDELSVATT
jgi:hypothetical protein